MDYAAFEAIEMAVFDTAGLTGSFQVLNGPSQYVLFTGNGFENDIKILKFYNASNVGIILSYDGVKRQDFIPATSGFILDLQTNHANNSSYGSGTLNGRKGQLVYGTGSAGTGNLYIIGYR